METNPYGKRSDTSRAARDLSQLLKQTAQARAALAVLQEGLSRQVDDIQAAKLVETNEELVLAMMRARTKGDAEAAENTERAVTARRDELDAMSKDYERRHAQLQEANEQLLLSALSAEELRAVAEQAQQQQTEFMATMAHELRNPLGPIRIAASLLSRVPAEQLPQAQAVIERQVAHMSRLVDDLLDVSRIKAGKLRIECVHVEVAQIIDEALDMVRPAIGKRHQRLNIEMPDRALTVNGDPCRLVQIVSNLLDNASKYTPQEGSIDLRAEVDGGSVVITIADSGIGISPEALPKIFDPFVQDTHAIVFNGVGLGLGLTVVRKLVAAHDGTVTVGSPGVGRGSRFVVTLPLLVPPQP